MAYKAEIAVDVKGLKAVKTLETSLNKISGKISAINKISIGNSKAAKIEEKVAKSKEAQRVSMIQTRRVGDAVQRAADKGLQTEKALAAVKRAAKADAQGALKVSIEQRKIALEELKAQQQIAKVVKDKTLTGFGPKSPVFGRSTQMDSAGNVSAILQDPTTKVSPVQQALQKMEERSARNTKQAVINRKKSLSLGKDIVRIKKQEATQNARNLRSEQKQTSQAAERLKVQTANRLNASITPSGDFSRLSDRQSRDARGKRTFMNNPLVSGLAKIPGVNPTRGFDFGSALISGGFPLLFGQGPGVAAAGALGGGIGGMFGQMGGFAGGIAATAAVQSIQNAINAISELGQAMGPFTQNTQAVTDALGLQGSAEEARIKLIEQTKGKTAAFNAAMNLMSTQIGQKGVDSLKQFGENTRLLTSSFTLAITKLQAFTAGVANFIARLTGLEGSLEAGAATRTVAAAAGEGDAQAQALVDRRRSAEAMGSRGGEGRRKKVLLDQISAEEKIFAIRRNTTIEADNLKQKFDALGISLKAEKEESQRILELRKQGINPELAKTLASIEKEGTIAKDNLQVEIDKLLDKQAKEGELNEKLQTRLTTLEKIQDEIDEEVDGMSQLAKETDKLNDLTKNLKSNFERIGESIASGVTDNITAAIQGTKSLGDAAKSILNDLSSSLIKLGVNTMLSKIPGFGGLPILGTRSKGGPVKTGGSFVVGEKGPELFVPRRSGTIIPNDKLAGGGSTNISVNIDASGSSVQGNEQQGKELGRVISAAIQSELIKQRRPGGLLR